MDCWLITGGAGFIGCHFVRAALREPSRRVVVLDKLTYAGNKLNLSDVSGDSRFTFVEGDIADGALVEKLLAEHTPSAVVNFAAESHVDRSIDGPRNFVATNVVGTFELLEAMRRRHPAVRFVHVSTDEVYGALGDDGSFLESTPYAPNSPYAATKAAADHLVRAYARTYGLSAVITNGSNTYGPYQFPEKLIPLTILNALDGRPLPIYGDGLYVRDWLHVEDHVAGILAALDRGKAGERYNIGGGNERTNLALVDMICGALESIVPSGKRPYRELKTHVVDRSAHDRRYAVDSKKARRELGWAPSREFAAGLAETVRWYVENRAWVDAVQAKAQYTRERLGA
ncbi:MAG TPA: dTDP-glucose 4,6-dehydratase [Candidatus Polarisedimenticolaceae bacterium]|nr:dTDP-glucose 4,6-dehydratase [Candidatus Polarisedimenticolaceae bacterium]